MEVDADELQVRLSLWQKPPAKITSGYLGLYAKLASSADKGAILKME